MCPEGNLWIMDIFLFILFYIFDISIKDTYFLKYLTQEVNGLVVRYIGLTVPRILFEIVYFCHLLESPI